ncbi:MAG: SDR family oxidoreductase [Polyangiaceae bacterium]|nr:SDR family oxidoreductase [Polyangiaceae bacterium]
MEFENKVVAITGAGTGIGKETARALHAAGASLILNGRRQDVLARTAHEIDPRGERVTVVAGDIGRVDTSRALMAAAEKRFGGLDVLINAAGIFKPLAFEAHSEEVFDAYVATILKGTFFASHAAVPLLAARGGGAIVNVGSMWAMQAIGATPSAAYSAAKAGVHALTRNLAIELAPKRIRVNTVAPAVVDTPVYESFVPRAELRATLASFDAFHPLGRIGRAADLAAAILFFAGDQSTWITGTVLPVDGGVMAGRN